jgi:hypothetical protein
MPAGLALDKHEDLIVADLGNHSVRKVALPDGRATTVAGSVEGGNAGAGYADGMGTASRFNSPAGVALDGSNAILVADRDNHWVRKVSGEGGVVTTVAVHEQAGKVDGTGPTARFNEPITLTIDQKGQLVVAEWRIEDSERVVESSLVPPARLAATETAVQ